MSTRAAAVGFDWERPADVLAKIEEEVAELREAVERSGGAGDAEDRRRHVEEEMGDLLFAIANLARKLGVEPESALRQSDDKFARRFTELERRFAARGESLQQAGLARMEEEWARVKSLRGRVGRLHRHDPPDPVLQQALVEVDQQPDPQAGGLQVRHHLRHVNRLDRRHGLDLHDDLALHHQVDSLPANPRAAIDNVDGLLRLERQSSRRPVRSAAPARRLTPRNPGPSSRWTAIRGSDDPLRDAVEIVRNGLAQASLRPLQPQSTTETTETDCPRRAGLRGAVFDGAGEGCESQANMRHVRLRFASRSTGRPLCPSTGRPLEDRLACVRLREILCVSSVSSVVHFVNSAGARESAHGEARAVGVDRDRAMDVGAIDARRRSPRTAAARRR